MKTAKKLVTVVFPKSVLAEAKAVQKKHGLRTLSALLRVAVEDTSALNLKTKEEPQVQVSFRVDERVLGTMSKLASQNNKSVAEVVRQLVKNVGRVPAKRFAVAAASEPAPRKAAKKPVAKKVESVPAKKAAKSAKPAKPVKAVKPATKQVKKPVAKKAASVPAKKRK